MPTLVHVPELGEDLEFPDDASESDIASAIEEQIGQKSSRSGPLLDRLPMEPNLRFGNNTPNLGNSDLMGLPVGQVQPDISQTSSAALTVPFSPFSMSAEDLEQGQRRVELDQLQRGQGPAVEEGGLGAQLGLGVPRGLAQLGEQGWGALEGAGSAAEYMPAGVVPGTDFMRTLRPFFGERRQVAAENVANLETIAGNTGGPKFAGDVVAGAISSAPSLAAAPVGGFIPAVVMAGVQSYGAGFSEAKQRGLDDFDAQQDGLVKGAITAGATFAFGKTGIEALATPATREGFKKALFEIFVKGGVAEGAEEMSDTVVSTTYDYLRRDPSLTFEAGLENALKSFGIGAIVGSGVTAAAQAGAPRAATDQQTQAIDMLPQGQSALQGAPLHPEPITKSAPVSAPVVVQEEVAGAVGEARGQEVATLSSSESVAASSQEEFDSALKQSGLGATNAGYTAALSMMPEQRSRTESLLAEIEARNTEIQAEFEAASPDSPEYELLYNQVSSLSQKAQFIREGARMFDAINAVAAGTTTLSEAETTGVDMGAVALKFGEKNNLTAEAAVQLSKAVKSPNEAATLESLEKHWRQKFKDAKSRGDKAAAQLRAQFFKEAREAATPTKAPNETTQEKEAPVLTDQPAGAIALPGPSLAPAAAPVPSKTPKSQRQIIADLAKGLKLPIRFGRLRTTKFAGYFLKVADLIGSKRANDIPVVTHEVGHKLDTEFNLSSNPAIASELDVLGDPATPGSRSSWTASKHRTYKMGEGVAEFVRLWMTDPAKALADAPNTHAYFESVLDANKDFGDVMRQARDDIQVWRTAEPQARLRSHISVGSNPNKTRYTLSQLTRDVVDDLHIMRLAVDDANKLGSADLPPSQNPYLLARNLRGSYGMAGTFIQAGAVNFNSKEVQLGTSLEDALKPVAGRINDFRDWIVAKRAQELHKQGRNTGLVDSDVNTTAAKFDSDPAFQEAFTKIKAWNDAVLQYAVDSGLVTAEGAVNMRKMNQDYVPMHRVFEVGAGEPGSEGAGTGRGLNVGTPGSLKGLKGSSRDIVDPLETMIRNAYAIITAAEKSAINTAVANLSTRQGMGKWVERIATPKQQVKVGLAKIREQLESEGADLTAVPDDLLLTFFQNSGKAPFGENVIKIAQNGEAQFYRLNKDLFDTFNALDLEDSGKLIQIISSPAQLLRAGVTLTPDFALANVFRDTFGAAIISKHGVLPFEVTLRGIAAMIGNPKLVAEWAAAGGKQSIEATYFDRTKLQSFLKERITKDLTPAERALIITKSPLTALRWFTGALEEATRIGEYSTAYKSLTKGGMPDGEARRLAAFEARDRQDFAKGGAKTKIVRRMTPFWNAGLVANTRLAQAFKERPVQTTLKGIAFITLPKLLEQAVNWDDEDYWDRPQWERDYFFLIPIGKGKDGHTRFLRLPTPFEVGVIFGTFPGRVLQWAKQNDTEAMKTFPAVFLRNAIPNPIPPTVQVVFSDFLSGKKGWDVWRGRTVVPEALADLPPEMQFTEQTSVTARNLGKLLGYSPMKIDHIIQGTAGGLGQQTVHQILDRAFESLGGGERTAQGKIPGGRFVTTPATVSSESVDQFYKTLEELRTEVAGEKRGREPKMNTGWAPVFEANSRLIADFRKRGRETTDPAEKAEIRELVLSIARETMLLYREDKP